MTGRDDEVTAIPAVRWIVRRPSNGEVMGTFVSRVLAKKVAARWGGLVASNLAVAVKRERS
jgi:hypothetical protein